MSVQFYWGTPFCRQTKFRFISVKPRHLINCPTDFAFRILCKKSKKSKNRKFVVQKVIKTMQKAVLNFNFNNIIEYSFKEIIIPFLEPTQTINLRWPFDNYCTYNTIIVNIVQFLFSPYLLISIRFSGFKFL